MDVTTIKTADLVSYFNNHAAKAGFTTVKKFADRKTAERRVTELNAKLEALKPATPKPAAKATEAKTYTVQPNARGDFHAVRATSKVAAFIDLISRPQGATVAELAKLLSPKATVRGILQYDMRQLVGYGYRFDGERFYIVLPKDMDAPTPHKVAEAA